MFTVSKDMFCCVPGSSATGVKPKAGTRQQLWSEPIVEMCRRTIGIQSVKCAPTQTCSNHYFLYLLDTNKLVYKV